MTRTEPTLAVVLILALAVPASAHPDYETPVTTVKGAAGENLKVVLHYTDGIIGVDPVKLHVVDPAGKIVAETTYARDYVTLDSGDGRLYVFRVDDDALRFWQGWELDGGTLKEMPTSLGLALSANLRAHWLAYGFSTVFFCAAAASWVRRVQKAGTWFVSPKWEFLAPAWLLLTFAHGNVSLLLVVGLTLVALVPVFLVMRFDKAPRRFDPSANKGLAFGHLESRGF